MEEYALTYDIRRAYADWQAAENYFENVTDPDLIDFAIYDIEAAKKKYIYMLKRAKAEYVEQA